MTNPTTPSTLSSLLPPLNSVTCVSEAIDNNGRHQQQQPQQSPRIIAPIGYATGAPVATSVAAAAVTTAAPTWYPIYSYSSSSSLSSSLLHQPNMNTKHMTYFHILQQLLFDGHVSIVKMLMTKMPLPDIPTLVPNNFLERIIEEFFREKFYYRCSRSQNHQHQQQPLMSIQSWRPYSNNNNNASTIIQMPRPQSNSGGGGSGAVGGNLTRNTNANIVRVRQQQQHRRQSSSPPPPPQPSHQQHIKQNLRISCKFGSMGTGVGQLNMPHGFCIGPQDSVVIADTNNHRISVFDIGGNFLHCFGEKGTKEGQLYLPRKVAMLPPNWIINTENISSKSKNRNDDDDEKRHQELEQEEDKNKLPIYVVCDRGAKRSRMQLFSLQGDYIRSIPIVYVDIVSGLCTTQDRKIIIVDSVRSCVYVLNECGELLFRFSCAPNTIEPSDVAVHQQHYFICDFQGHRVNVFNHRGELVGKISSPYTKFPNGIDISDMGDIVVGDSHGNRFHVTLFNTVISDGGDGCGDGGDELQLQLQQQQLLGYFRCPYLKVSRCCGLKITSDGHIVTLAKNNHHVLVLETINV